MRIKKSIITWLLAVLIAGLFLPTRLNAQRYELNLNGQWEFEQTEKAYPPKRFTRTIPVPGLIDLAIPRIDQYDDLFMGDQDPKYSWYRCEFLVPPEQIDQKAILTIRKSRFNTQVILNDFDLGTFMECSTPIECDLTNYLREEGENVLMIRVDDISRIPVQSAFSMDIEQFTYIPGIWDDVFITYTGPVRVARSLCLPDAKNEKVNVKILLENHDNKIKREFSLLDYETDVSIYIREKVSGKVVSEQFNLTTMVKCLNRKEVALEVPMKNAKLWSPGTPFLYEAVIEVTTHGKPTDRFIDVFGMRDFRANGNQLELNSEKVVLLGSNITISRFMGDPDRADLLWDREWVREFLIDIPQALRWNSFRFTIGLAPDFWYDLADECGIMIQNEWPMWKNRGWDQQIGKEYTDWIWADGSHPSIVIWDAMNESSHHFIGNVLIPQLKELDPTRIWDVGYMDERTMVNNEMDEPHYYPLIFSQRTTKQKVEETRLNYRFGKLFYQADYLMRPESSSVPQVVNEYAWMWMNRDGTPAFIAKGKTDPEDILPGKHYFKPLNDWKTESDRIPGLFEYYIGPDASPSECWSLYSYCFQIQTEALRSRRYIDGVMGFSYLTMNKGYTGDWFLEPISELVPAPALLWQYHCFAPFAVFIDQEDGRYLKNPKIFSPGESHIFNLLGVNDSPSGKSGSLSVKLIDKEGIEVFEVTIGLSIAAHFEEHVAVNVLLPEKTGGYLLVSELTDPENSTQISRRYIRVGTVEEKVEFPELKINPPVKPNKN
jgi:beta-galactosidase